MGLSISQRREKPVMEAFQKQITVHSNHTDSAPVIYLPVVIGDGSEVYERCRELDCPPFTLVAIGGLNWNRELSPWECDGTVRDAEPFGGQASGFLDELLNQIIPDVESSLPCPPVWRGIAGYSLAGLFSLWALWQTDAFDRAASASGSLWFPDFVDRAAQRHLPAARKPSTCRSAKRRPRRPTA